MHISSLNRTDQDLIPNLLIHCKVLYRYGHMNRLMYLSDDIWRTSVSQSTVLGGCRPISRLLWYLYEPNYVSSKIAACRGLIGAPT